VAEALYHVDSPDRVHLLSLHISGAKEALNAKLLPLLCCPESQAIPKAIRNPGSSENALYPDGLSLPIKRGMPHILHRRCVWQLARGLRLGQYHQDDKQIYDQTGVDIDFSNCRSFTAEPWIDITHQFNMALELSEAAAR